MTDTSTLDTLTGIDRAVAKSHPEVKQFTDAGTHHYQSGERVAWAKKVRRPDADHETGVRVNGITDSDSVWAHRNLPAEAMAAQILRSLELEE